MGAARARRGEPRGEPVGGVGAGDAQARGRGRAPSAARSRASRSGWSAQTKDRSRRFGRGVGGVERRAVAAGALGHRRRRQRRRRAAPVGREADRRGRIAPGGGAEGVGEAVPQQVQPGAGPDLRADQRQAGLGGDGQVAGGERGAALGLVGLRRAVEAVEQERRRAPPAPRRPRPTARRRRRRAAGRRRRGRGRGRRAPARAARRRGAAAARRRGSTDRRASRAPGRRPRRRARGGRRPACRAGR